MTQGPGFYARTRAPTPSRSHARVLGPLSLLVSVASAGCAGLSASSAVDGTSAWLQRAKVPAALAVDDTSRPRFAQYRARLLDEELDESRAVELALAASPRGQFLLAESWAAQAATAQAGAAPSLTLGLERITRGDERVTGRSLGFSLVDWLTWPLRSRAADRSLAVQRLQLAQELLALQARVRQQWVRAVASAQLLTYHGQVQDAAQASAELAERMQQVGNYSRLQRAREQVFLADATVQLARAQHQARVEHETLVRLLGLSTRESQTLRLPQRLPDVPSAARSAAEVTQAAQGERIDLALAYAQWQQAAGTHNLVWTTWADVGLTLGREREGAARARSTELEWHLPLLDTAQLRSQSTEAAAQAAASRLELAANDAASELRERYSSYRSAHELALHARETVVPLRKTITDEMLLKYNGMLVGVFELMADARSQVGAVITAIEAQRDFWLAHSALDAAVLGAPVAATGLSPGRVATDTASPRH